MGAFAFDRAIMPGEAEPECDRAGSNDRHRDEIDLMELVKQRLCRILRPHYHACRGRTVAGVHYRAVCESGGCDDGYWSLLSAYWSLCLRPSYHAG